MQISEQEENYIIWQSQAVSFYLASRMLVLNGYGGLLGPAVYCGLHALETLMKATLVYWDKSFDPVEAGHSFAKMLRTIRNKVPGAKSVNIAIPDSRALAIARYPAQRRGLLVRSDFLDKLDKDFFVLLTLVPPLPSPLLRGVIKGNEASQILWRENKQVDNLVNFLFPNGGT